MLKKWFVDKAFDARIYMVTNETMWELERLSTMDPGRLGKIALLVQISRLEEDAPYNQFLIDPKSGDKEFMMSYYSQVEDTRNLGVKRIKHILRETPAIVKINPGFAEHGEDIKRSLDVWLSTIGIAIKPNIESNVKRIWKSLKESDIITGLAKLRAYENFARPITGRDVFPVTDDQLITAAKFMPNLS